MLRSEGVLVFLVMDSRLMLSSCTWQKHMQSGERIDLDRRECRKPAGAVARSRMVFLSLLQEEGSK
jgi:hypothetical protein